MLSKGRPHFYLSLKTTYYRAYLLIFAIMEKTFTFFLSALFLLMASSVMTQTNITTDQLALLSLKSQSWSPAIFVCHWVGVTCGSRQQRVKSLNLSNMALTGEIPHEFGNLSFLVSLDLRSNNFHGNLPQERQLSVNNFSRKVPSWFGFLHQLQFLSLRNNSFTDSIPSSFSNMSTLEILYLDFNSIEGQIPKVIGNLINLRELSLYGNNLIGSIPPSISNASRLKTLEISDNSLQGNIPEGIGNLHNMKVLSIQANQLTGNSLSGYLLNGLCNGLPILKGLYLSYNKLHGRMPTSLSNCSQLQILSSSYNDLTGEIPKVISNLIELEVIILENNRFSGPLQMEIFNISGLRKIDLSFNNLSGSLPPNMCSILPNIEKLYLASLTNLVGTIPNSISNCSKLTDLELTHNQLTGLIPNSIGYLTHLQYLKLAGNNLTSDSSLSFLTSLTNSRNLTVLDIS
ncbi:hypothetical protein P3S68_002994 [Capsicum galapagoense]